VGNEAVDAVYQCGLSRAGPSEDQDLLPPFYPEVDVLQGSFGLGSVLKREVFKFKGRTFIQL
jgi:hypothetical protein